MYTPKYNQITNIDEAVSFMQRYSFATIVTVAHGQLTATHLPFVIEQRDGNIVLISHFAKANHQAIDIFECTPLVIFTEPHAYISPTHYEKDQNVPTWNYIAVHACGKATLISNAALVLKKTIKCYEAGYLEKWDSFPDEYKTKMMNGIVAFEILVDDLQGKSKLSQNRSITEQENIVKAFTASADQNERDIADYMLRGLK